MKQYSEKEREEIMKRFQKSGIKKGEFAKAEGVNESTLSKWISKRKKATKEEVKFMKVGIVKESRIEKEIKIKIGEIEIVVTENTSEEALMKALRVVEVALSRVLCK